VSRRIALRVTGLGLIAALVLAGCAAAEPSPVDSIATFRVADGSTYKVLITDPGDLEVVDKLSKGEDAPSIPNGAIVRETGVNTDWSWSLDPNDFAFSDVVDGSCDTTPQEIEDGTFEGDRFCPWSAIVIALEPAP
jgi:hypothetical protein